VFGWLQLRLRATHIRRELAAFGYLNPEVVGAAMAVSSVDVMINAPLSKRWKSKG
jgi:cation transport ATPase